MQSIVDLPEDVDVSPDDDMRLVRVEFESGSESIEDVQVFDRVEWLNDGRDDETWRRLAQQEFEDHDVSDRDGERLVLLELFGWWVENEAEDADPHETTWRGSYGDVYGKTDVPAVVDHEWSEGKKAWSFPTIKNKRGDWVSPGKYGPGGPKSVIPVIFPVGTPRKIDAAPVRTREATQAAFENDLDTNADWETALENARERVERRGEMMDAELDISAIETLEDQHRVGHQDANKAFVKFMSIMKDELGTDVDPVTMTAANEAIAQAVRNCHDLDDPREDDETF